MRPRKWVLLTALCLFLLGNALYFGKRRLEQNRNIEKLLIEAIAPSIKGTFTLEAFRIGFFSVYLRNVDVSLPMQAIRLEIPTIKVGLSYAKLLQSRGDIPYSINRIILIKPVVTYSLGKYEADTARPLSPSSTSNPPEIQFPKSSLQALTLKEGAINIRDQHGVIISAASNLSGMLFNNLFETTLSVTGRFGASKKNLSLQGAFSSLKDRHHLSIRLANARIDQALMFKNYTISNGILNGVIECTFNHTCTPDSTEMHGWVTFSDGSILMNNATHRFTSVAIRLLLDHHRCYFSSVSGIYRGISINGDGEWYFTRIPSAQATLTGSRIVSDSLYGFIPDSLLTRLSGIDTLTAHLDWRLKDDLSLALSAKGLQLKQTPVNNVEAAMRVSSANIAIDSMRIFSNLYEIQVTGNVPYTSAAQLLDLDFRVKVDSLPVNVVSFNELRAFGSVTGTVASPDINCRVSAKDLRYGGILLGNQDYIVTAHNRHYSFKSIESDTVSPISISGTIDSLFFANPSARFSGTITSRPIQTYLSDVYASHAIDSAFLKFTGSGWLPNVTITVDAFAASPTFSGNVHANMHQLDSDTGVFQWDMATVNARYNKERLYASARGLLTSDAIVIESLSIMDGITGSGMLYHTIHPSTVEARLDYHMKVSKFMKFLPKETLIPSVENGTITGYTFITGTTDSLLTHSRIKCHHLSIGGVDSFSTILVASTSPGSATMLPFAITRRQHSVIQVDTVHWTRDSFSFNGFFHELTPKLLFETELASSVKLDAPLSGTITTSGNGMPLQFSLTAPFASFNQLHIDSIVCSGHIDTTGITMTSCTFSDSTRTKGTVSGYVPWSFMGRNTVDRDTLQGEFRLTGDLLASIGANFKSPIAGHGNGTADIAFSTAGGNWRFTKGTISISSGSILEVNPFVPDKVRNYSCTIAIDSTGIVDTWMSGTIKRRPISIISEHTIPDGYEPVIIGPLDFGMLQTITPKKGVDLHLPGFMALKERGSIEFAGKNPFKHFTISGPLDRLKLTGTWLLRDLEFTFPFLPTKETAWDLDPFPYITWEMNVIPGNRRAMYFWDLTGKKNRILRFMEGFLDLSSIVKLRGRDLDNTFQIHGAIRSYKGAVYYGRVFDRYFDVGVEFNPQKPRKNGKYDNFPLLWGSAETFADTSRHKRIKLTCMVNDPTTGSISEKGRLVDGPAPNISFHLSSDFEDIPGEGERDFYRQAGLTFTTIGGAGGMVTDFGEQMFHRYLLQRWERRIAKKLGLDVINIESSIVSNYFSKLYERQFDGLLSDGDYLALANVGVTVGRYFFHDNLFLKARGELIPIDMMLTPEYSIGLEFQPSRFILMDLNYGFHKTETSSIVHNPLLMLQLRLPITNLRRSLKF